MSLVGMIPIPDDHIEPLKTPYIDKAGKKCVFSVPENYFLTLEPRILKGIIKAENDLSLLDSENSENFSFTESIERDQKDGGTAYFESLNRRITDKIEAARINGSGSILDLPRTNPFTVPKGYFENLPLVINRLTYQRKELMIPVLRLLSTGSGRIFNLSRIAAAASIALLALFTGLHYQSIIKSTNEYARSSTEERFNYRYDIDESLVEDELIGHSGIEIESADPIIQRANTSEVERYLLDHLDIKTLIEEI